MGREELDGGDFGALLVVAGVVGGVDGLHVVEFFGGVDEALAVDESGDEFGGEGGESESCDVVTSVDPREYFALGETPHPNHLIKAASSNGVWYQLTQSHRRANIRVLKLLQRRNLPHVPHKHLKIRPCRHKHLMILPTNIRHILRMPSLKIHILSLRNLPLQQVIRATHLRQHFPDSDKAAHAARRQHEPVQTEFDHKDGFVLG